MAEVITTQRLTLIPLTHQAAQAALGDRAELARLLGVTVPTDWPEKSYGQALPVIAGQLSRDPALAHWSRVTARQADKKLIGAVGYKGRPDRSGTVEIAYDLIPSARGQGYATEAVRAMIDWAFSQPEVERVVARIRPNNTASNRVATKVGMRRSRPNALFRLLMLLHLPLPYVWWEVGRDSRGST